MVLKAADFLGEETDELAEAQDMFEDFMNEADPAFENLFEDIDLYSKK